MLVLLSAQGACPVHTRARTQHTRVHTQFLLLTHPEKEKYSKKERPVGLLTLCACGVGVGCCPWGTPFKISPQTTHWLEALLLPPRAPMKREVTRCSWVSGPL